MSILKQKALKNKVEWKREKKLPPVGAWGNYRRSNRPYTVNRERERRLLVDVSNLTLAYEGRTVISDLSFQVHSGDYICIIGENGSGKTTLLNALLGLKKQSGGKIEFCDVKRSEIGVLPQKTPVQNDFPALVSEIVLSGRVGKKFGAAYNRQDKKIAFENMEKLGITSIAKQSFRELSGGQQQRVLLARALCAAEKLIVLDEPTASLDPKASADMYNLISDINCGENMAVIMVSHDIDHALEYASHILQINKRSVFFGTADEYKQEFGQHICTCKSERETASYGDSDAYKFKGGEVDA